jgi:repressor LexA
MQEPVDKVDEVRAALRRVMDRKGIRPKPLAKRAGLGDTSVRDLLDNPGRDIKIGTLHKLADALEVDVSDLLGAPGVSITGRIGAGGSIIFEEFDAGIVPRPPGASGKLEALEVSGDSMLPRYSSGDVVYIQKDHEGVVDSSIGDYCAVRLKSGETYVKILAYGSRPGFFSLRSLNAADIEDVELEWATPILFVLSRAARRSLGY